MSSYGAEGYAASPQVLLAIRGSWEDAAKATTPVYAGIPPSASPSGSGFWDYDKPIDDLYPIQQVAGPIMGTNGAGVRAGRNVLHGGGAFLAEYDGVDTVTLLERVGAPHPWQRGWTVGDDVRLLAPAGQPATGIVVRGASTGAQAPNDHYFIAADAGPSNRGGSVILHHSSPNPPDNSTLAFDPDTQGRHGLLSDALRVRGGIRLFTCAGGVTGVPQPPDVDAPDWVTLNATRHGGPRFSGWLAATFASVDAFLSGEVFGAPLVAAGPEQQLGVSADGRPWRVGGINAKGLIGVHNGKHAPFNWTDDPEPPVIFGEGFRYRADAMIDYKGRRKHSYGNGCEGDGVREISIVLPIGQPPECDPTKPVDLEPVPGEYEYPPNRIFYSPGGQLGSELSFVPTPEVI
jgi:hypothetical protein